MSGMRPLAVLGDNITTDHLSPSNAIQASSAAGEYCAKMGLPEEAQEKLLLRSTGGLAFFNISKMDLSKLGESGIKANLESYIQGFSKDAREIFEYFNFAEFIGQLNDANLYTKSYKRSGKPI
jgi:type I restriction enzyme M protein